MTILAAAKVHWVAEGRGSVNADFGNSINSASLSSAWMGSSLGIEGNDAGKWDGASSFCWSNSDIVNTR